jgi:hypothetical protein
VKSTNVDIKKFNGKREGERQERESARERERD